ncbi:MAG: hypothetical protein FJ130_04150 [Deltaproteobacteria bacterium]|nr:hypothetical protein [Deltaproteobacteria bacterium]
MKEQIVKYLSATPSHSLGVKRWQIIVFAIVLFTAPIIVSYLPIGSKLRQEQIAEHKAQTRVELESATYFVKSETGLSNEDAKLIAFLILKYYWNLNPKDFRLIMIQLLGSRDLTAPTGDHELDKPLQDIRQELKQLGIESRRTRLVFKVDFMFKDDVANDIYIVYLPTFEIERVNIR